MIDDNEDDAALLTAVAQELPTVPPMEIVLMSTSVLQLAGLLQLALRHPEVDGTTREVGTRFLGCVREHLEHYPALIELLRRGDDPAHDKPGGRRR